MSAVEGSVGIGHCEEQSFGTYSGESSCCGTLALVSPATVCDHVIVVSGHLGQGRDWTLCAIFGVFCFCFEQGSCYEQADLMYDPSTSVFPVLGSQVCLCEVFVYMVSSGPLES